MSTRIQQALSKQFEKHRIVFWYDEKRELRNDFEAVSLDGVEKVVLERNAFGLKYQMLREQAKQKFLVYHDGAAPADTKNWLLDVQLAHSEFSTDQVAIWRDELGLDFGFVDLLQQHLHFFGSAKRREQLKALLEGTDTHNDVRKKMLAVITGADARLDSILESLLQELSVESESKWNLILKSELAEFLWSQVQHSYGYHSEEPGITDFAIELFKSCYALALHGDPMMNQEALAFLKRWKDSRRHEVSFEALSQEAAQVLDIESKLHNQDFRELIEIDYFEVVEQKIISDLVKSIVSSTVSSGDVTLLVRQRRQSHWFKKYQDLYEAIDYAGQFSQLLADSKLEMHSLSDGIEQYAAHWFKVDQLYRKFIYHVRKSGHASLTKQLNEQIENLYSNEFLLKLNDRWQVHVDACEKWSAQNTKSQRNFFKQHV
ncbi:MAG: BREX-1 system phosphatase PglZ type A, partial [Rubritalea sp.]|uniref:BREX-1 system phosphatase PglZ type A n=1 Tax=Rubritalea sp. TaxID=2109375 RepID=UPI0032421B34